MIKANVASNLPCQGKDRLQLAGSLAQSFGVADAPAADGQAAASTGQP